MVEKQETVKVYSIFASLNGEVNLFGQGSLCVFIRFSGCNFNTKDRPPCSYCDTEYALSPNSGEEMTVDEILWKVKTFGINKVTITGGEPLMQYEGFAALTKALFRKGYKIVVETNGSYPCGGFGVDCWVVDYKLSSSGCMEQMVWQAFEKLREVDFVKFVIADRRDYEDARGVRVWLKESLGLNCQIAFSPVHGKLDPNILIEWLMEDKISDVILNFQLHKLLNLKEEK